MCLKYDTSEFKLWRLFFVRFGKPAPSISSTVRFISYFLIFSNNMNDESIDSGSKSETPEYETKEKQSARCFLRERFLRAATGLVGKECTFHMYSNTNVKGIFRGNDIEFENLLAEKLKTPFAEIPYSIIRSNDVNYLDFKSFSL